MPGENIIRKWPRWSLSRRRPPPTASWLMSTNSLPLTRRGGKSFPAKFVRGCSPTGVMTKTDTAIFYMANFRRRRCRRRHIRSVRFRYPTFAAKCVPTRKYFSRLLLLLSSSSFASLSLSAVMRYENLWLQHNSIVACSERRFRQFHGEVSG